MNTLRWDNTAVQAKGIAIILIVAAHCTPVINSKNQINQMTQHFLEIVGTFGIGVFFFFSGLFFYKTKHGFVEFWKRKIKTLLVPWLVCGTFVYLYVYLRKNQISFISWLEWILGSGTYLYYLSVLVMLYFILWAAKRHRILIYLMIVLSIISIILTDKTTLLNGINAYLNPFNFLLWFALGMLFCGKELELYRLCERTRIFTIILLFVIVIVFTINGISLSYFKSYYIPLEIIAIWSIFGISSKKNNRLLISLGEISFSIYLLHMPIAGIVSKLIGRIDICILTLLCPLIVTAITGGFVLLTMKLCNNRFGDYIKIAIGIRGASEKKY